jgi:23S rRNA pseudouridine2604 synthase
VTQDNKRINKYLADRGLCSRREAEELIRKGWVKVNGQVLSDLAYRVQPKDKVEVDEKAQRHLNEKLTLIINKPIGYVSAQAEGDYQPAIRLTTVQNFYGSQNPPRIRHQGFAPAGRLDIDSTGLLILTQNGKLAKQIIAPDSDVEKEYVVYVEGTISQKQINELCHGLHLDGRPLKKARVTHEGGQKLRFILQEGRKRQIRRMCELVDLEVRSLKRVRIGQLKLGSLPEGQWRLLKRNEKI